MPNITTGRQVAEWVRIRSTCARPLETQDLNFIETCNFISPRQLDPSPQQHRAPSWWNTLALISNEVSWMSSLPFSKKKERWLWHHTYHVTVFAVSPSPPEQFRDKSSVDHSIPSPTAAQRGSQTCLHRTAAKGGTRIRIQHGFLMAPCGATPVGLHGCALIWRLINSSLMTHSWGCALISSHWVGFSLSK